MGTMDSWITSRDAEERGRWVEFEGGARFLIRSAKSITAQTAYLKARAPHKAEMLRLERLKKDLPSELAERVVVEWVANGLIADWEHVSIGDGAELPYTPDNARKLLAQAHHVRQFIIDYAEDIALFRDEAMGGAEKNSETPASTS